MLVSNSTSLFGLSKKPFIYVIADRSTGADGSPASFVKNQAGSQTTSDTSVTPKMKYLALNNRKSFNYDASKEITLSSPASLAGSITVIAVEKRTNASSNYFFCEHGPNASTSEGFYVWGNNNGGMGLRQGSQASFGVPTVSADWIKTQGVFYTRIARCDHTGQLYKLRVNGVDVPATNGVPSNWGTASAVTAAITIGKRVGGALDYRGELCLLACFSGYLTDAECERAESILKRRYRHY
jgi:hypothetical protein